uniref:VPS37 C-terminal domain-containing protein n=1 Tax=Rhabditophanes sp. KR3021 TaxID=114890 RepID=A0AC35UF10_9BILA
MSTKSSHSSLILEDPEIEKPLSQDNKAVSLVNVSSSIDEKKSKGWFFPLLSRKHNTSISETPTLSSKSLNNNKVLEFEGINNKPTASPVTPHNFNVFQRIGTIFSKSSNVTVSPEPTDKMELSPITATTYQTPPSPPALSPISTKSQDNLKSEKWYDLNSPVQSPTPPFQPNVSRHLKEAQIEVELLDQFVAEFRENKMKAFTDSNLEELRRMHLDQIEISAIHTRLSRCQALRPLQNIEELEGSFDLMSKKLDDLHISMELFSPGMASTILN